MVALKVGGIHSEGFKSRWLRDKQAVATWNLGTTSEFDMNSHLQAMGERYSFGSLRANLNHWRHLLY
jgi:hypothetical protein